MGLMCSTLSIISNLRINQHKYRSKGSININIAEIWIIHFLYLSELETKGATSMAVKLGETSPIILKWKSNLNSGQTAAVVNQKSAGNQKARRSDSLQMNASINRSDDNRMTESEFHFSDLRNSFSHFSPITGYMSESSRPPISTASASTTLLMSRVVLDSL